MQVRVGFGLEDYAENLVDLCCDHEVPFDSGEKTASDKK